MEIGMLWFDNEGSRTLGEKVSLAGAYYAKKYGCVPTICFVNPQALTGDVENVDGLELRGSAMILPNHFWIGVSDGNK